MRAIFLRTAVLQGKKQVTLELSLSGMDGNYTALTSDLAYDNSQITYNSAEKGKLFDSLTVNDARTRMIWELKSGSMNENGTVATVVFDVNDGVTGDIKINVKNIKIAAYKEEGSLDVERIDMDETSTSVTIEATQPDPKPDPEPQPDPKPDPEPQPDPKPDKPNPDQPETKPDSTAAAATAVPAAQTPASPKTGDTANLALYGVLGVACVVALGVVIYRRKKANH